MAKEFPSGQRARSGQLSEVINKSEELDRRIGEAREKIKVLDPKDDFWKGSSNGMITSLQTAKQQTLSHKNDGAYDEEKEQLEGISGELSNLQSSIQTDLQSFKNNPETFRETISVGSSSFVFNQLLSKPKMLVYTSGVFPNITNTLQRPSLRRTMDISKNGLITTDMTDRVVFDAYNDANGMMKNNVECLELTEAVLSNGSMELKMDMVFTAKTILSSSPSTTENIIGVVHKQLKCKLVISRIDGHI